MQMPAAVESIGGSEGQSESPFAVSESTPLRAAAYSRVASSWEGWSQWRPSQSQYEVTESMPPGACGSYQASSWANLAEKQKCLVGLEEKKLWVNIAICLCPPSPSVTQTTEASTPFERIKGPLYSYEEVLYFITSTVSAEMNSEIPNRPADWGGSSLLL